MSESPAGFPAGLFAARGEAGDVSPACGEASGTAVAVGRGRGAGARVPEVRSMVDTGGAATST